MKLQLLQSAELTHRNVKDFCEIFKISLQSMTKSSSRQSGWCTSGSQLSRIADLLRKWLHPPRKSVFKHLPQVRRNGLSVVINGEHADAFGDTGSTRNIVDENYVRKRNLSLTADQFRYGDGKRHETAFTRGRGVRHWLCWLERASNKK